ncbi:hypothetical protein PMAYCL1PPCAC_25042, partial [Pristionchus mayeri]
MEVVNVANEGGDWEAVIRWDVYEEDAKRAIDESPSRKYLSPPIKVKELMWRIALRCKNKEEIPTLALHLERMESENTMWSVCENAEVAVINHEDNEKTISGE